MSTNKLAAEVLGTYVLVLGGTAAIVSAAAGGAPTNIVIVAFAFGLALMAALYAFGEISGGHYNPAVSLAMTLDGRMDPSVDGWVLGRADRWSNARVADAAGGNEHRDRCGHDDHVR